MDHKENNLQWPVYPTEAITVDLVHTIIFSVNSRSIMRKMFTKFNHFCSKQHSEIYIYIGKTAHQFH